MNQPNDYYVKISDASTGNRLTPRTTGSVANNKQGLDWQGEINGSAQEPQFLESQSQ